MASAFRVAPPDKHVTSSRRNSVMNLLCLKLTYDPTADGDLLRRCRKLSVSHLNIDAVETKEGNGNGVR